MDKKSKILQKNGEIVFDALRSMDDPKTLTDIVKFVAASNNAEPDKIKGSVKEVLDAAVQYGFIKKTGYKYSVKPVEAESASESENEIEPTDASKRRRKSRVTRRKRSRSRRRKTKF